MILQFSEVSPTWTAWDVPSCGDSLCLSMTDLQCDISLWFSRRGQPTARPHLTPADATHVRTPKDAYFCRSLKDYWHLRQAAVTMADATTLWCAVQNVMGHRVICLETDCGHACLFDHFIFCTIWQWHVSSERHVSGHTSRKVSHLCAHGNHPDALFIFTLLSHCGPDSSVSIATDYGLDGLGIESQWGRDFLHTSRPALGPTQPPVQWVPGISRG
jgi:hypothetical protein